MCVCVCVEEKEGGGPLMTETVPFLWNLLPFWARASLYTDSLERGIELFRIPKGRNKIPDWKRISKGMTWKRNLLHVRKDG